MKRTAFIILLYSLSFLVYPQEKRLALVIGNGEYEYGGELTNPVNDANSMEQVLQAVGFDVIKYENLDQKMMRQAIDNFGSLLKNYDVGLFFYAGHGVQAKSFNYLIPVDATLVSEEDVEYNCVRADRVLGKMEAVANKTNIVILDACRNNPFERSWTRSPTGKGLAFMNAPTGSLIAYATSPGNTASDGSGSNGLYTSALLTYIIEPNITVIEMFQRVRTLVRLNSDGDQIPWESTSLEGNFYFTNKVVAVNASNEIKAVEDSISFPEPNWKLTRGGFIDQRDHNYYKWVRYDDQIWMAQNLNYKTDSGSFCLYDEPENCSSFGRLYTWEIAKTVCHEGWHLPSEEEAEILVKYLRSRFKNRHDSYMDGGNSGFNVIVEGGWKQYNGEYRIGHTERVTNSLTRFWTATSKGKNKDKICIILYVTNDDDNFFYNYKTAGIGKFFFKTSGLCSYYVRCIKDQ